MITSNQGADRPLTSKWQVLSYITSKVDVNEMSMMNMPIFSFA